MQAKVGSHQVGIHQKGGIINQNGLKYGELSVIYLELSVKLNFK